MSKNVKNNTGLSDLSALVGDISDDELLKQLAAPVEPPAKNESGKLTALARCYIAEAITAATRVPSLKLNTDYRLELLTRREKLLAALKTASSEAEAVVMVVRDLATDGDAFDAQKLLQSVMQQSLWMAAVDTSRADRVNDPLTADAFEHDMTHGVDAASIGRDGNAPYGLENAADNEDAIMGFAGDTEAPVVPSYEEIKAALVDVNLWVNTLGTAIGLLPIPVTSVSIGHNARGKAIWREVHDIDEAIRVQQDRNLKALQKRNAAKAAEAVLRNAALFDAAVAQAA